MAKINFSSVLTKLEGDPLKDDKQQDLTLASAAKQALLVWTRRQQDSKSMIITY